MITAQSKSRTTIYHHERTNAWLDSDKKDVFTKIKPGLQGWSRNWFSIWGLPMWRLVKRKEDKKGDESLFYSNNLPCSWLSPCGELWEGRNEKCKGKGLFLSSLQTCRDIILSFLCFWPGVLAHIFNPRTGGTEAGKYVSSRPPSSM